MAKCKNCKHLKYKDDGRERYAWCTLIGDNPDLEYERFCGAFKRTTNADRIRNMTIEELAEFLCEYDACQMCTYNSDNLCRTMNCDEIGITENWLKSEVGE